MLLLNRVLMNSKGSAMVLAMVAMSFLGIIGAAFVTLSSSNVNVSARLRDDVAAQYLAEAGAQWALKHLNETDVTSATINANTATSGRYTVTITPGNAANKIIISEGRVNHSTRIVRLEVTPGSGDDTSGNGAVLKNAGFSQGNMTINSPQINGDVMSNAKITVNSHQNNTITGIAYTNTKPTIWNSQAVGGGFSTFTGDIKLNVDGLIPAIPAMPAIPNFTKPSTPLNSTWLGNPEWKDDTYTLPGGSYSIGNYDDWHQNYVVPAGQAVTIYVDGNFTLGRNITGDNITIYSTGNITINSGGSIQGSADGKIQIYAKGSVTINRGATITGGDVTVQADKALTNGGSIRGSDNGKVGIYANGSVALNNESIITGGNTVVQTNNSMAFNGGSVQGSVDGKAEIYADGSIALNSGSAITGGNAVVQTNSNVAFNGGSINQNLSEAVSKVYVTGNVALNNVSVISGKGIGMLVATGNIALNGGDAPKTIFIAGGNIAGNSGSLVGGLYTNGTLTMNGATIDYDSSLIQELGFGTSLRIISYSDYDSK